MTRIIFAMVAVTFLAGCDAANKAMDQVLNEQPPMTLVFQSGHKMLVGGKPTHIFGSDECPEADKVIKALFGPAPNEGERSCVVISPETTSIKLLVGFAEGSTLETWTVERDGNRTMLRRADGTYLQEAN